MILRLKKRYQLLVLILVVVALALVYSIINVTFLVFAVALIIFLAFYPLFIRFYRRIFYVRENFSEAYFLDVGDYELAIYYYPKKKHLKKKAPVLLCHGLAVNHRFFDIDAENSLPLHLNELGYDVYAIDLRGAGRSRSKITDNLDYDFDDLVGDLPKVLKAVLLHSREQGNPQSSLYYLGHSLGAMIMYAFFTSQHQDTKLVKGFISLSGPSRISALAHPVIVDFLKVKKFTDRVNLVKAAQLFAPFAGLSSTRFDDFLYNKYAMSKVKLKRFLTYAVANISVRLTQQLLASIISSSARGVDFDMSKIEVPTLMMTGTSDNLCTPLDMQLAFAKLKTKNKDKTLHLLGKLYGSHVDYCHGSIIMGEDAPREVFSRIGSWLERQT